MAIFFVYQESISFFCCIESVTMRASINKVGILYITKCKEVILCINILRFHIILNKKHYRSLSIGTVLNEAQKTSISHAMMEIAEISYLMGKDLIQGQHIKLLNHGKLTKHFTVE